VEAVAEMFQTVQTVFRVTLKESEYIKWVDSSRRRYTPDSWCHIAISCSTAIWWITSLPEYHDG